MSFIRKIVTRKSNTVPMNLGSCVIRLFPGITRTRITVLRDGKEKREWVYQGLVLRNSVPNCDVPGHTEEVIATYERISDPCEFWNKLPAHSKNLYGWQYVPKPSEIGLLKEDQVRLMINQATNGFLLVVIQNAITT